MACPSVTVRVVVEPPLVVSSASDTPPPSPPPRTDGDGDGDGGCGEPRPCPCPCRSLSSDNEAELRPAARAPRLLADIARDIAAATAAVAAASDDDTEIDDRPGSLLSSVCARAPARRGSKLPAPPTPGKPNVWLSGLLSAPSLTSDVSPRRTAPAARGDPGCVTRPRTSSMLDLDALPMPWIRLCARARPSASDALDADTCELCRELALPEPEPELVFRERERGRKAPLIRARDVALPLREPSRDALGLG